MKIKYISLVIIIFFFISCKKEKSIDLIDLLGNWSSTENGVYQEYFFTESNMYVYRPESGDIFEYNYLIQNDSISRYLKHLDLKDKPHKYYDRIIKTDSLQIILSFRILNRLNDENTLEMYLNKEISHKTYDKFGLIRRGFALGDK